MTKNELTYRRQHLKKSADQLLAEGRKLTDQDRAKLVNVLLELEGMNIKVTGHYDDSKNNQVPVPRIRKKKRTSKNQQLILTF